MDGYHDNESYLNNKSLKGHPSRWAGIDENLLTFTLPVGIPSCHVFAILAGELKTKSILNKSLHPLFSSHWNHLALGQCFSIILLL